MTRRWYAIYTKSRNEKKAAQELRSRGVEVYLPTIKTLRQWSDRKKWVEEPLFKSYLFVRILDKDYLDVLQARGVVHFITFQKKRVPIPDPQIEAVRAYLNETDPIPPDELHFEPGSRVEITRGTMRGLTGTMVKVRGKHRVVIEIEVINEKLFLNVPKSFLQALS
jgi:transcription elongation factor/antiterminator RfaH